MPSSMLGLTYIYLANLTHILLRGFTGTAICGINRANRCPYPPFPFPPITLIRAPAPATETVPLLDLSYNPYSNWLHDA
jgi:hypothetical protein